MKFEPLRVQGAYAVTLDRRGDERGWFARVFCQQEMAAAGLDPRINQVNNSYSPNPGTLRGIHYQVGGFEETKLVRAVHGAVFDVVVDLRVDSPTYKRWAGIEVSAQNRVMLYVPRGCGHAILTLEPDTELMYFSSQQYSPENERGLAWNDPKIGIEWPRAPENISEKDSAWPRLVEGSNTSRSL